MGNKKLKGGSGAREKRNLEGVGSAYLDPSPDRSSV